MAEQLLLANSAICACTEELAHLLIAWDQPISPGLWPHRHLLLNLVGRVFALSGDSRRALRTRQPQLVAQVVDPVPLFPQLLDDALHLRQLIQQGVMEVFRRLLGYVLQVVCICRRSPPIFPGFLANQIGWDATPMANSPESCLHQQRHGHGIEILRVKLHELLRLDDTFCF